MVFKRRDKPALATRVMELLMPRRGWRRAFEYLGHRVRRLPDTPHRIALGVACGVFATFTPLFGLHFFLAAGLAWLTRANILASLAGTFVGNPLTFPLIASLSLALGRRMLGHGASGRDPSRVLDAFVQFFAGLRDGVLSLFGYSAPDWQKLALVVQEVLWPYAVGGVLPGLLAAAAGYAVTRPLVAAYQARRRARARARADELLARAKSEADAAAPPAYNAENGTGEKT